MIDMLFSERALSIVCCMVVFSAAAMRGNLLRLTRKSVTPWVAIEALGLVTIMGAAMGMIGEWFLPGLEEWHAETLLVAGLTLFCIGLTRGRLCQVGARLQGWDGGDRRRPRVRGEAWDR